MDRVRARYIPDLLHVHADDLSFLWAQRRVALTSRKHTLREYGEINERIEAHLQGLAIAPPSVLAELIQPFLESGDRDEVCTGAFAILRLGDPVALCRVTAAFALASGSALAGLRDALSLALPERVARELEAVLNDAAPVTAAAAAAVLANHRLLDSQSARLADLLCDTNPAASTLAWRAALIADLHCTASSRERRPYFEAVEHGAPEVRHAAWAAAAWSSQPWTLSRLREFAADNDAVALHWLAVLGEDADVALLLHAASQQPVARVRCELLARFGHPAALRPLLRWMGEGDAVLGVEARIAFEHITGCDIRAKRASMPLSDTADDFDREMAPLVWMPNAEKAKQLMVDREADWLQHPRWCKGTPMRLTEDSGAFLVMDMEARWDCAARAALNGRLVSTPCPIH